MASRFKAGGIRNGCLYGHGDNSANARDGREAPHLIILLGLDDDLTFELVDLCGEYLDLIDNFGQGKARSRRQSSILFIPDDRRQCFHVGDAGRSDDTQLSHMGAQRVDRLGSLTHEQRPRSEDHYRCLLLCSLDRHEPHRLSRHRFGNWLRIGGVGLAALDERLDVLGRQQSDVMPEGRDLPRPVVRTRTCFHTHQARWQSFEKAQHFGTA
ncbi:MAG: hypothetical protein ABS76_38575 [Pelagibacterium sp. SCN 64-44]|nr:MAG: hypothetical protein ABS76_38575 [Pelagibacterium sp. SCN 64-44]